MKLILALALIVTITMGIVTGGIANLATTQVSVTTTATLLVPQRLGRSSVTVVNHGTTAVYVGNSASVTTATGVLLNGAAGASLVLGTTSPLYGIVTAGTQVVSVAEGF